LEEFGKRSVCKYSTSVSSDVQAKYAAELASRAAGKAMKKMTEGHCSATLVRTRDLLSTHALDLLPTVIHPREHPVSHAPTPHLPCADLDPRHSTFFVLRSIDLIKALIAVRSE
jgi:hypothetical protein